MFCDKSWEGIILNNNCVEFIVKLRLQIDFLCLVNNNAIYDPIMKIAKGWIKMN